MFLCRSIAEPFKYGDEIPPIEIVLFAMLLSGFAESEIMAEPLASFIEIESCASPASPSKAIIPNSFRTSPDAAVSKPSKFI